MSNAFATRHTNKETISSGECGMGMTNRDLVAATFAAWEAGTGHFTDLLADGVRWTVTGNSAAAKAYESKQQFVDEALRPFGQRFREPLRPVAIRGLYV